MKITIESTDQITRLEGVEVRLWKGKTERGIPCLVFVHRIAAHEDNAEEFQAEVRERLPPGQLTDLIAIMLSDSLKRPGGN